MNKTLIFISRILIGIVFIYSGFVKLVDPLGSTYKFSDYFEAMGLIWAQPSSFVLSIILSISEFIIGIGILFNLKIKLSVLGALIMMIIFTPVTLWLAVADPVQDCGCFGDALVLTNWQTFFKNLIIIIPIVYLFILRKKIEPLFTCKQQWGIISIFTIASSGILYYCYNNLPIIDFRPYKIGTHIPTAMIIPPDAPAPVWESMFTYSKNGKTKTFKVDNLPDSTWTFVDASHKLISKGYEAPVHDFTITGDDGVDITDIILSNSNYNFLLISYDLDKANFTNFDKINKIADFCNQNHMGFYALTASGNESVYNFIDNYNPNFELYATDEITLKTIIRSNPGLVVIKDGTIINKWHYNNLPQPNNLSETITSASLLQYKKIADNYFVITLITLSLILMSILFIVTQVLIKKTKAN